MTPEEAARIPHSGTGRVLDKDEDGFCIHLDRASMKCRIWHRRPRVCRAYDCNDDPMLPVALGGKFRNIVELARATTRSGARASRRRIVPRL